MFNLKKTALAVIALANTAVFAGTMGAVCSPVDVTVPCEVYAWDIGGRALYLQPSAINSIASLYTFQTQGYNNQPLTNPQITGTRGVGTEWGWGFQLEASYHFCTGNDFHVNWYNFRNGKSSNPINGYTVVSPPDPAVNYGVYNLAYSANPNWDQVNIEFGQHVDFGEKKFARLHGGFNFSRFGTNGYSNRVYDVYTSPSTYPEYNITDTYSTLYNGFGPRVGMDLNYEWGNGAGIYVNGALSLLAGTSKSYFNHNDWYTVKDDYVLTTSRYNVVGELDTKVGFMYSFICAQGDLSLDVGWVWAAYNAGLNSIYDVSVDNGLKDTANNFGIQGLYFGAKWVGYAG